MPHWIKEPTFERLKSALESVYFTAKLQRTVVNSYPDGKTPIPIGPNSEDKEWDKVISLCEHLGLRPSMVSLASKKKPKSCRHTIVIKGKPIPRVYGSYQTKVCVNCGRAKRFTWNDEPVGRWGFIDPKEYEIDEER